MRIKLNGEVRMQIFLITITILILVTVYGIKRQKEIQQFKQNLEMNIDKVVKTGAVFGKDGNLYIVVNWQAFKDTCEVCGREIQNFRGYKYYGHVLCDSCFENFQEYLYQFWKKQELKKENKGS